MTNALDGRSQEVENGLFFKEISTSSETPMKASFRLDEEKKKSNQDQPKTHGKN